MADDPRAADWGRLLFFDARFSRNGKLSCASCHQPDRAFVDGRTRSTGIGPGQRNTPTVVGAAYSTWFYWDGRRDSLWSQALIPFEAADEMGSSRTSVIKVVAADPGYRARYQALFEALPPASWFDSLPALAGPFGDPETRDRWARLPAREQKRVNQIYARVGQAIEAYERTLMPQPSALDRFVDVLVRKGAAAAAHELTDQQQHGLRLFISDRTRCLRCHNGPLLTNGDFSNIGTGTLRGKQLDFGRVFGLQAVLMDEFNCLGPYSSAPPEICTALRFVDRSSNAHLEGAFKVPSLRLVSQTAPYFHDGRFASLADVVRFYNRPKVRIDGVDLEPIELSDQEIDALVAFLSVL